MEAGAPRKLAITPRALRSAGSGTKATQLLAALSSCALCLVAACGGPDELFPTSATGGFFPAGAEEELTAEEKRKHPLVLAHGLMGFGEAARSLLARAAELAPGSRAPGLIDELTGEWNIQYFLGVKKALIEAGYDVRTPAVNPFASSVDRGEELLAHVNNILDEAGVEKVNLVGHSQGGLDIRYVAHEIGDSGRIGAVLSVSSPHLGVPLAEKLLAGYSFIDRLLSKLPFSWGERIRKKIEAFDVFRRIYGDVAKDANLRTALESIRTQNLLQFNEQYPDNPNVKYYSVAGASMISRERAASACEPDVPSPSFVSWPDNCIDFLWEPWNLVLASMIDETNDGQVEVERAKWGTFLGCVPADHYDEVGHLPFAGCVLAKRYESYKDILCPRYARCFDHLAFYLGIARFVTAAAMDEGS